MTKSNVSRIRTSAVATALAMTVMASSNVMSAETATATIADPNGAVIGQATLTQGTTGVLIYVKVSGLSPGPHGIHLHSVGKCSPDFKASKGHINLEDKKHGLLNPQGPDNGDLPNIFAAADGTAEAELFTTRVSIAGGQAALLDADGAAIVIHANRDDHVQQPIGGAGGRVGCGIVEGD